MTSSKIEIFVVDSDPVAGRLSCDLLKDHGFSPVLFSDTVDALPAVKTRAPKAVIVDIFNPGINGLEFCRSLKEDPETAKLKIILLSQKPYEFEKLEAYRLRADAYFKKPYDVENFARQVSHIVAGTAENLAGKLERFRAKTPEMPAYVNQQIPENSLRLAIYGCRGFSPLAYSSASAYGRQTPCAAVETRDKIFIFDAGSGIIRLGEEIIKKGGPREIWILFSHYHLGHIIGLTGFAPLYDPAYAINFAGPDNPGCKLQDILRSVFYTNPIFAGRTPLADVTAYEIQKNASELSGGAVLSSTYANHPTNALCLSLELMGRKIVYAPDSEIPCQSTAFDSYAEKLSDFCFGADYLIHNCSFTSQKHAEGCGYSRAQETVELAFRAEAAELTLFHFDSSLTDEDIDAIRTEAEDAASKCGYTGLVRLAREGVSSLLEEKKAKEPSEETGMTEVEASPETSAAEQKAAPESGPAAETTAVHQTAVQSHEDEHEHGGFS